MAEKIFEGQSNYGWGLTFDLTGKTPAINKRIFDKLVDAQSYADDFSDSAIEGLLLSVINDTEKNNGVYFALTVKRNENDEPAKLLKLSFGDLEEAQKYINNKIEELTKQYQTDVANILAIIGEVVEGKTVVDMVNEVAAENAANKAAIDAYTVNNKQISENPILDSNDLLISETYSAITQPAENITPGDLMTTAISKIEVMLANTTLALTAAINDIESRVGRPAEYDENGNVVSEATGLYKKYEDLEKSIKNE